MVTTIIMRQESLDFFFRSFAEEQMNFLYTGDFTDELTDNLIDLNNLQFGTNEGLKSSQRKSGFLIAECFQNIVRHTDLSNQDSYFHIKNNDGFFSLISGNTIQNEIIPTLERQLKQLNKLTSEELKEMYRKTLVEGSFSNKGGAGLGLIEMARKTKNKLSFTFSEIDAIKSYFYFQLKLNTSEPAKNDLRSNFDQTISLRNRMLNDDLFLIYKGVISTQVTIAVLGMIEKSLRSVDKKVVFTKFMSFFEKVSGVELPNNQENSNMLFIGENDQEYSMATSCFLRNEEALKIQKIIKSYKSIDAKTLNKEYNNLLKEGSESSKANFSLELIEMLRNSTKLEFDLRSYADNVSFVSIILRFEKKYSISFPSVVKEKKENQVPSHSFH